MRQLKITKSITNRESQSLDKYLQDIGREELITAEEEVELARKIKQGDQSALEKLTRPNSSVTVNSNSLTPIFNALVTLKIPKELGLTSRALPLIRISVILGIPEIFPIKSIRPSGSGLP